MATAETLKIATFAAPLSRDGPGLLLRDLGREDDQIDSVLAIIADASPDVLVLTDFDYDLDGLALAAFAARAGYDHSFALAPNTGVPTGFDVDGNGRLGEARDAMGYGRFTGDGGMAILSRWPFGKATDHSRVLWRDLPGAQWPDGNDALMAIQRLSSAGHWAVDVMAPGGPVALMAWSATPPVFDGPEDRNGLRNRDELRFWTHLLDDATPAHFVILGNANLDPIDGDGRKAAIASFLNDPRLQDPMPASQGGLAAADALHQGDPALDTTDWPDGRPGNLRVSYVLPSTDWRIVDAGVFWPAPDDPKAALLGKDGLAAGPHRMVWVQISR